MKKSGGKDKKKKERGKGIPLFKIHWGKKRVSPDRSKKEILALWTPGK